MSLTANGSVAANLQIVPINRCDDFKFETRFRYLNQFHQLLLRKPFDIDARHFNDEIAFFEAAKLCSNPQKTERIYERGF